MPLKTKNSRESFSLSLPPILLVGSVLAATFYGLILFGPLDSELLRRYCLGHPVAVASVSLFFIGLVSLGQKWFQTTAQSSGTKTAASALQRLLGEGEDVAPAKRPDWLLASWNVLPQRTRLSWFGERLTNVLELQISRGRRHQMESDLKTLQESDADRQHDSYSLLRIINWAMPMLGFLGTVLGISQTLGRLDTQLLATQQQEAMNQLTAGLYVAFDTTAIALVLTVFLMFLQFAVSRVELKLLATIDRETSSSLIEFLSVDPFDAHETLLQPVREMTTELLETIGQLTQQQAAIWSRSIEESQQRWVAWTENASDRIESDLQSRIGQALDQHVTSLTELQEEANRQSDNRWQQWRTTLSDQARLINDQQKEAIKQSKLLGDLVESTTELRKMEEVVHESVSRVENIGRLEKAAVCVGEAVAVLAACLERAGVIRGAPVKPRASKDAELQIHTNQPDLDSSRKAA